MENQLTISALFLPFALSPVGFPILVLVLFGTVPSLFATCAMLRSCGVAP